MQDSLVFTQYQKRKEAFQHRPTLEGAQSFSISGLLCWQQGLIGDATYVREVLEPVRSYLLAGNAPMRDGKPEA